MTVLAMLKPPGLKWVAKKMFPRQFWQYKFDAFSNAVFEDELSLVAPLCDSNKTSVDVGADAGVYSVNMLGASRDVIAFEPRPRQASELQAMFDSVGAPLRVETVALSDRSGTTKMRTLVDALGCSTIESENLLQDEDGSTQEEFEVTVSRLDDYDLDAVGFIKIDVEGHELAVLRGAKETIQKCQPVLLIEAEERHRKHAVPDITEFLEGLGYEGFFLLEKRLRSLGDFVVEEHQDRKNLGGWKSGWERKGVYVNNFLFTPHDQVDRLVEAVEGLAQPSH